MADGFDRLTSRGTRTAQVTLALDPNDAQRLKAARAKAETARRAAAAKEDSERLRAEAEDAEEALADIEAEAVTFTVHLRGIGPARVEELILEHPASKAQKAKARRLHGGDPSNVAQWDEDKFPPAFLAEAIERITFSDDPDGTQTISDLPVSRMAELWASRWSVGDRQTIFLTAIQLDQAPSSVERLGEG